jgi:hypothetical protein
MKNFSMTASIVLFLAGSATPALAADKGDVALTHCDVSLGTIAVVDGDTQGWTKFGLGSPRELIATMATKSGCFQLHDPRSGRNADFLVNAIAGDTEEVDKGVSIARDAIAQGLVRSGAVGQLASAMPIPMLGSVMGMFGGLGGKKKTYAAGLRVISPATGQTLISGEGQAKRSSLAFGEGQNAWAASLSGTSASAYTSSKDGQMLSAAFVQAFNSVVAQGSALAAARGPTASASKAYVTAIDTKMYGQANKANVVRTLRAASSLTPTGRRDGLFVQVRDAYGTTGWVSVEDLK